MVAPPTEHEILDVNRRYHDVAAESYDAKWGISFGEIGHQQVLGKLTKLLGPQPGPFARSLEIGAGTGYFCLNLLQTGVVARGDVHGHQPRHARDARAQRARARPRRRDRRLRRRRAAVRGRELRPRARPRRAAPPARPRPLLRRVHARAQARRDAVLRRRAVALGRPARRRAQARRARRPRRCGGSALKAAPGAHRTTAPTTSRSTRSRPSSTSTPSSPPTSSATPPAPGFTDVRVRGEELLANWFGWFNRTLEATADPKDIPWGWIKYAYRGYIAAPARRPRAARAAPAAADLLQPDARGPQARVTPAALSTRPARSTCCATSARCVDTGLGAGRVRRRLRDRGREHGGDRRGRRSRSC